MRESHVPSDEQPETPRIDPHDLDVALRVLAEVAQLGSDHPEFVTVRNAAAVMI